MSSFYIWTLEQPVLGPGKPKVVTKSHEQFVEWAQQKAPEDVATFAWRTQLAIVFVETIEELGLALSVSDFVNAFGFHPSILAQTRGLEVSTAASGLRGLQSFSKGRRSYRMNSCKSGVLWTWDPAKRYTKGLLYATGCMKRGKRGGAPGIGKKQLQVLYSLKQHTELRKNPFLIGLLVVKAEAFHSQEWLDIDESRLGMFHLKAVHHNYADHLRNLTENHTDLRKLSAEACETAKRISYTATWLQAMERSIKFIAQGSQTLLEHEFSSLPQQSFVRSMLHRNL